ncbi:MAG: metallophosphoesterase family protein [Planctomycetaceae bacterium]
MSQNLANSSGGRTIAIGDVHGCDVALATLIDLIAPTADDRLVLLGDIIDRGPNPRGCIDYILQLRERVPTVYLKGNHEEMFLEAMYGGSWSSTWPNYGGREMLESYGGGFSAIPVRHQDFIRNGKDFWQSETHLFVHGNVRAHVEVDEESAQVLRWDRFDPNQPRHVSGKRVICGHTAQGGGRPAVSPDYVCIDTCVYCPNGRLTALDVDTNTVWQSNQLGSTWGPMTIEQAATA